MFEIQRLFTAVLTALGFSCPLIAVEESAGSKNVLDVTINRITGESVVLKDAYKGKVVLLVNVASKCGLTKQYKALQSLYDTYQGDGFEIIGFPCNDFLQQEPGPAKEIITFCQKNYGVTFDLMEKIKVKGDSAHPLYKYLTDKNQNAPFGGQIKWNFEKFLIDHHGKVIQRFSPTTKPQNKKVVAQIEAALVARNKVTQATHFLGREIAPVMGYGGAPWLLREAREQEESTIEMVKALEIKTGQVICDFGCGNGYHTLSFAKEVGGNGKVYGVDIQQKMLDALAQRATKVGLKNISAIACTPEDSHLPANTFDMLFMCDVYHELSDPQGVLKQIKASLKRGGLLVLVEYRAEDPEVPIKPLHKMTKSQVEKEMHANGFKLVRSYDKLPWQHLLFYTPEIN